MKHRVRKAVFPAAGLGTRFLPATKAQPKEMLPLVDKPLIQYLLRKIDAHFRTNVVPDYNEMTIEHIAPENPPASKTISAELVGSLGNMLFIPEKLNVKLANKPFTKKKQILIANNDRLNSVQYCPRAMHESSRHAHAMRQAVLRLSVKPRIEVFTGVRRNVS